MQEACVMLAHAQQRRTEGEEQLVRVSWEGCMLCA
jgi:hypothetical protein